MQKDGGALPVYFMTVKERTSKNKIILLFLFLISFAGGLFLYSPLSAVLPQATPLPLRRFLLLFESTPSLSSFLGGIGGYAFLFLFLFLFSGSFFCRPLCLAFCVCRGCMLGFSFGAATFSLSPLPTVLFVLGEGAGSALFLSYTFSCIVHVRALALRF